MAQIIGKNVYGDVYVRWRQNNERYFRRLRAGECRARAKTVDTNDGAEVIALKCPVQSPYKYPPLPNQEEC